MSLLAVILLVGIVVFATHALEAVTGFGCTVLAFPFVIAITGDIVLAKVVLSVLAWVLAVYIVATNFREVEWKQFAVIALLAGVGMPLGIYVFRSFDSALLTKLLGGFIVMSAAVQLWKVFYARQAASGRKGWTGYLYLLLGGVVHGAFATGGPLIVLYSAQAIPRKGAFRATMCMVWATLNSVLMIQYLATGEITRTAAVDIAAMLPFLAAGIVAGEVIHKKVNETTFKKVVFSTLLIVGIIMVAL